MFGKLLRVPLLGFLAGMLAMVNFWGCSSDKKAETIAVDNADTLLKFVKVVNIKTKQDECWQLAYIKEWYKERVQPPELNYEQDLKKLSYIDLWFLKYEILARNGYLFMEPTLRSHFNVYKWYQPIYDKPDYVVEVNPKEFEFLKKIVHEEKERLKDLVVPSENHPMFNYDFVINKQQFCNIPENIESHLRRDNFVMIKADHEQLFHVYEGNSYDYIPSFITTDLVFQLLHKHIEQMFRNIENPYMFNLVNAMMLSIYNEAASGAARASTPAAKDGYEWTQTYAAIALSLLQNKTFNVPEKYRDNYQEELGKCLSSDGRNSQFLNSKLSEYMQFIPRGYYDSDENYRRYFKCIKWLNSAKIVVAAPADLSHSVTMAYTLNASQEASKLFSRFSEIIHFIAGDENNISMSVIDNMLSNEYSSLRLDDLLKPEKLGEIYAKLKRADPRQFQVPVGTEFAKTEFAKMTVLFYAGAYTPDNYVYSQLVHVKNPERKRILPKALDVLAAYGNTAADSILHYVYKEQENWGEYDSRLRVVKKTLSERKVNPSNLYEETLSLIRNLNQREAQAPYAMRAPRWQLKDLNTSLGGYTFMRHTNVLYIEELMAAECGGGDDGPPPPIHLAYVEPNMAFWKGAIKLIDFIESETSRLKINSENISKIDTNIITMLKVLQNASEKELKGMLLTDKEFENLDGIGGWVEGLTTDILQNDHMPEREKDIAIVINVFGHRDSLNNVRILNEALGHANEIYVVVPINGLPYIAKGAVWSYYEFPTNAPLSDDLWRNSIKTKTIPASPVWLNDILIKSTPLQTSPTFRCLF
ncbi:MAG: DUF3160 domain-containing protein [Ignavibacteria bacterium]|nr:DUF3160 domain-containing protein [Ignavibacteria bacterium]